MTKASRKVRSRRRRYAYFKGRIAEVLASSFLRLKGYRVLARDFRKPVGEIDIIAFRQNTLVAVEVKQRPTVESALHALGPKQRRRISRALEAFLAERPDLSSADIRFDLILITSFLKPPVHVENI